MRTLSAALRLLDARPARADVRLGGRLLLVFLEASLVDTTLVLPWTPVSPDEFFVAGDAGPRVGVRRASCCGILRTHVFERKQHVPFAVWCVALYAPARPMPRIAILTSNRD